MSSGQSREVSRRTAAPWAVVGALLFYASDATLAWNRFVAPMRFGPVAVMVTYHPAQAGLVGWLVGPEVVGGHRHRRRGAED